MITQAPAGANDEVRADPGEVQPVAHETADRIATGTITALPFIALGIVCWQVWSDLLRWSDVAVFLIMYVLTGPRRDRRLPPPPHPPQLQDQPPAARPARHPRLGRDRGAGDLLGRRPPQAPHLLRPGGRPAQPPRRARRRLARRAQGPRPRPRRLALHPHPPRRAQALRARPDRRSGHLVRRPHLPVLGARRVRGRVRARLRDRRHPRRRADRSPMGRAACGCSWCTTSPTASTRCATSSAASASRPRTSRATCSGWRCPRSARAGTTTTTPSRPRPSTGCARWEIDPSAIVIRGLEKLGLVWDVVRIDPERQAAQKPPA